MKNRHLIFIVIAMILSFGCSKSSNSTSTVTPPTPTPEPQIVFTIDASNASISPGSSFPVTVILTSAMPSAKGVNIEATLTDQTNNTLLSQGGTTTSNTLKSTINVINLPQQHWCNATIKVYSAATPSNTASQSFTVVYK